MLAGKKDLGELDHLERSLCMIRDRVEKYKNIVSTSYLSEDSDGPSNNLPSIDLKSYEKFKRLCNFSVFKHLKTSNTLPQSKTMK